MGRKAIDLSTISRDMVKQRLRKMQKSNTAHKGLSHNFNHEKPQKFHQLSDKIFKKYAPSPFTDHKVGLK